MGSQEDKIQKLLNAYTEKKNWSAKGWVKIVKDNLSKEQYKKLLAQKPPPFKRFHKTWTKKRITDIWKGDTWEQLIDYCTLTGIKPKQIMNSVAGRKIDHTKYTTMKIVELASRTPIKKSPRATYINLRHQLIKIDPKLKQRPNETYAKWHRRLYLRVHNALSRTD